jgi:rfaE bifunctional protein kinase chain/domain
VITAPRFTAITSRYPKLRVAVVGDLCLDRYLEIDPALQETSLETGLPVRNVARVRSQPGAAGTVLNNIAALGAGTIEVVSFCGDDGEGYELRRALGRVPGIALAHFVSAPDRATFTYCKPLVLESGRSPRELERLDRKNWTPTPEPLARALADAARSVCARCDAVVVMEQVDHAGTGVITDTMLAALREISAARPGLPIVADSRVGLGRYPALVFKMNAGELARHLGVARAPDVSEARRQAAALAARNQRIAVVTLAELGMVGATPDGQTAHVPALPVRGEIDVVGAGDSVTANLSLALAAGASLEEALTLATAAASVVIHQLGTTGTASVAQLAATLGLESTRARG